MDINVRAIDGVVHFNFTMSEVKYNKLMNSKAKVTVKPKEPTNRELLLLIAKKVTAMENTPTMKKELGINDK